jgi:murein DD-endopeptidase MepM/ murein hydrolase activator NlpD
MPIRWLRRRVVHAHKVRPPRRRWPLDAWLGAGLVVAVAAAVALAGSGTLIGGGGAAARATASPSGPVASLALEIVGPTPVVPTSSAAPAGSPGVTSSPSIAPAALLTGYRWPLEHARITADYGPRAGGIFVVAGKAFHDGVDVASFCGDHVRAAHDGVVLVAGRHVDRWIGWVGDIDRYHARLDRKDIWYTRAIMVIVDDGNGYRSVYMHLSRTAVEVGQHVRAGQLIGYEGMTGLASGCHLHYSIFDPDESSVFDTDPGLIRRLKLPAGEVARIDPLDVLPPPESAFLTWGWGARD